MKSSPTTSTNPRIRADAPESELVQDAFDRLRKQGNIAVHCGVPLLGRCVDLVYIQGDAVVTVEFKLQDWRRALVQARDHLLAADYAFICMPQRTVSEAMRQEVLAAGIGLLFFCDDGDWPFEVVIDAPRSKETWSVARTWVCDYLYDNQRGPNEP
jgi:hypothetical protein